MSDHADRRRGVVLEDGGDEEQSIAAAVCRDLRFGERAVSGR